MKTGKLKYRIALPVTGVVALLLIANICLSFALQEGQMKETLREQAYILSEQMQATWDFVAVNQYKINHDADGSYNFKGLHCSIAGLSVGALFTSRTDYKIRYASDQPRNELNVSDAFETKAIGQFREDDGVLECFGFDTFDDGSEYFRYVVPLRMEDSCQDCHGSPAGEMDVTNHPKEGMTEGDLVGVASISIPTAAFRENMFLRTLLQGLFLFVLSFGCIASIRWVTNKYVTDPLSKIEEAVDAAGKQTTIQRLSAEAIGAKDEVESLVDYFNDTAERLDRLHVGLEDQIRDRTEKLEMANSELAGQAAVLEKLNERLREDNKYKSHYFTMMSHELKTPLTAIVAYAAMLEDLGDGEGGNEQRIIGEIRSNASSLMRLINNILETAKLEAGKVKLDRQAVETVDIFNVLSKSLAPLANEKQIDLRFFRASKVPIFLADPDKLLHVLENLGSNAIKYSQPGQKVVFEAFYSKRDQTVQIRVIDDGMGIDEKDREVIFEKFIQSGNSLAQPVEGSGLGLALAKEYVELHGGSIHLSSEVGKGCIFKVTIPFVALDFEDEEGNDA